jgi:hypothetical protein
VADGRDFQILLVFATMVDPTGDVLPERPRTSPLVRRDVVREILVLIPGPLELGQLDTNEDSTCWRGCQDSDCTDRYPHEACYDFEDEREVNEWVDKK